MSKKRLILESLDEYGPTNIVDLYERLDTGQTKAQLSSYLAVLRHADGIIDCDHETWRWSITETGEKWLRNPKYKRKASKKIPLPTNEKPQAPINGSPKTEINMTIEGGLHTTKDVKELIDTINDEIGLEPTPIKPETTGTYMAPVAIESPIDHPPHYTDHPSGVECIQITEHMSFNLGNAIKYCWRAELKGRQKQDLEKALWYIKREIERLEAAK